MEFASRSYDSLTSSAMSNSSGTGEQSVESTVTVGTRTYDGGEDWGIVTVTVDTKSNKRSCTFLDRSEVLLPGIPNDIILQHVTPRLPLRAFDSLSSVSRCWHNVIQSGEVFDVRARSDATERLVVLNHNPKSGWVDSIALYSSRDDWCYQLPPIPALEKGVPWSCQSVSLDGKIYVLGGDGDEESDSVKVYVLDLLGQREWKQCAHMQFPRKKFGCIVMDGKIFVFGGIHEYEPVRGCEVYDPKSDSWSSIPPMKFLRFDHRVAAFGEELVVYGGSCYNDENHVDIRLIGGVHDAMFLEVYHPGKNEWRLVELFGRQDMDRVFMAEGKFYAMSLVGIYAHDDDIERSSWTDLHSFLLPAVEPRSEDYVRAEKCPVLAVNGELLTISHWQDTVTEKYELCVLRSKGFDGKSKELVWEKANCSLSFAEFSDSPFMYPIKI